MKRINPLYMAYDKEDSAQGTNKLYLDTNIVNYLRKSDLETFNELRKILLQKPPKFKLHYSSAHLGDYLKDETEHKNYDLQFMDQIGMNNFITFNEYEKGMFINNNRRAIDIFYHGRITNAQAKQEYLDIRKPRIDNMLLIWYEWFKTTLFHYENDPSFINTLAPEYVKIFNDLNSQVNLPSKDLTEINFIQSVDRHWNEHINVMNDKEKSRYALDILIVDENIIQYKKQNFDLTKPNLVSQIAGTEFEMKLRSHFQEVMEIQGLDMSSNYDEMPFFIGSYGILHILGIEQDKAKKFNISSSREDAAHCYFASSCNFLVTEDIGLYRRAKVLYGALGVTTKVFKAQEFNEYIKSNL